MSSDNSEDSDAFVSNAIIAACITGIIIIAALIVLSPRQKEPFSQLWLKPHKLNLTNADLDDENVKRIILSRNVSVYNSSLLGNDLYAFSYTEGDQMAWFPMGDGTFRPKETGNTFMVGPNSFFLDAVDLEGLQILFWEYPRVLDITRNDVRFSFVIENNLGRDHEYRSTIILSEGDRNATKAVINIPVEDSERKTVAVQIQLTEEEALEARELNFTKIIVRLDTAEEVFFWIGGSTR